MQERRFHGEIERLRSPQRLALLDTEQVVEICLEDMNATSVLDVGVGSGVFAEAFAGRGLDVTGIDANPSMIETAQRLVPKGHFQVAEAEALPYTDHTFDLVFLGHVLHETDERVKVLQEALRVARRRVVVLEWPYRETEVGPPLVHRLPVEEVVALAQEAGCQQVEVRQLTHMVCYRLTV